MGLRSFKFYNRVLIKLLNLYFEYFCPILEHYNILRKVGYGNVLMRIECPNTKVPGSLCLPSYVKDIDA